MKKSPYLNININSDNDILNKLQNFIGLYNHLH